MVVFLGRPGPSHRALQPIHNEGRAVRAQLAAHSPSRSGAVRYATSCACAPSSKEGAGGCGQQILGQAPAIASPSNASCRCRDTGASVHLCQTWADMIFRYHSAGCPSWQEMRHGLAVCRHISACASHHILGLFPCVSKCMSS